MRLGFIGTGTIAEAMVIGFLSSPAPDLEILLSPRNAEISARLAAKFPDQVTAAPSNQAVLDDCDLVVLAVRPQIARDVLAALIFRPDHHVLSVVATLSADDIGAMVLPATRVTRAAPLPFLAHGSGATVVTPPDPAVSTLFGRAGVVIEVEDDHAYAAMSTVTAIMASHFAMADSVATWLSREGVPPEKARRYVGQILSGLAGTAERAPDVNFARLAEAHATQGSFNEQLRAHLTDHGLFSAIASGLDALMRRMEGH